MRAWQVMCGAFLCLSLAACTGGEEANTLPPPTAEETRPASDGTADPETALIPPPAFPGQVMQAGFRALSGVEVVSNNRYLSADGQFLTLALEIRNTSDKPLGNVAVLVNFLDSQSRERGSERFSSFFFNLPPAYVVPMFLQIPTPPDFNDVVVLAQPEPLIDTSFTGEFDLPFTLEAPRREGQSTLVTGTLTNDRGVDLNAPAALVVLKKPDGSLLAVASALFTGESASIAAGATLNFEARFLFLPDEPIGETRLASVAYRMGQ